MYENQDYTMGATFDRVTTDPVVVMFAFFASLTGLAFVRYVVIRRLGSAIQSLCPICVRLLTTQKPPERYPNYFDVIPMHTLREKLGTKHMKQALRTLYREALARRMKNQENATKDLGPHAGKLIHGCHSYDLVDNKEYIDAFAMDSQCATTRRVSSV